MDGEGERALRVVVYSKPDCPLCDELLEELAALAHELPQALELRNILDSADDFARFRYLIPVLEVEGGALYYPPHTHATVRAALLAAAQAQNLDAAHHGAE